MKFAVFLFVCTVGAELVIASFVEDKCREMYEQKKGILIDGHCFVHSSVNVTKYEIAKQSCTHFPTDKAVGYLANIRSDYIRDELLSGPIDNRAYYIGLNNRKIFSLEANEERLVWYWAKGAESEYLSQPLEIFQYDISNVLKEFPKDKQGYGIFHILGSDSDKIWHFEAVTEEQQPKEGVGFLCEYEPKSHAKNLQAIGAMTALAILVSYFGATRF